MLRKFLTSALCVMVALSGVTVTKAQEPTEQPTEEVGLVEKEETAIKETEEPVVEETEEPVVEETEDPVA